MASGFLSDERLPSLVFIEGLLYGRPLAGQWGAREPPRPALGEQLVLWVMRGSRECNMVATKEGHQSLKDLPLTLQKIIIITIKLFSLGDTKNPAKASTSSQVLWREAGCPGNGDTRKQDKQTLVKYRWASCWLFSSQMVVFAQEFTASSVWACGGRRWSEEIIKSAAGNPPEWVPIQRFWACCI